MVSPDIRSLYSASSCNFGLDGVQTCFIVGVELGVDVGLNGMDVATGISVVAGVQPEMNKIDNDMQITIPVIHIFILTLVGMIISELLLSYF